MIIEIKTGYLTRVGTARIAPMGYGDDHVDLGIVDDKGEHETQTYFVGDTFEINGVIWRVMDITPPTPAPDYSPPGAGSGRTFCRITDSLI